MTLQTRLADLITAIGTDFKTYRTFLTGSSSGAFTLSTTAQDVKGAINELKTAQVVVPASSETASGIAEIATQAELTTGTDDLRIVTPLKHVTDGNVRWQAKSTNLTSLAGFTVSTDGALAANSDTVLATQKATKAYADGLLDAQNAFKYKGVLDASANPNYPAGNAGDVYKVSVAGRLGGASGAVVEVGDTATLLVDSSAAGNQATVGANWLITQTNIDGAVVGPATSVAGSFATFSGTTGKVISDSGVSVDTDGTLAANSNAKVPTDAAIRTYLGANYYNQAAFGNPDTDLVAAYTAAKA